MKKYLFTIVLIIYSLFTLAQKQTFDIATFSIPQGWKKEMGNGNLFISNINNTEGTWCKIGIYASMNSKGSVKLDFDSDWKTLVFEPLKVNEEYPQTESNEADGWKILSGTGNFNFNGSKCMALMTTLTGFGKTISIVSLTNSQSYLSQMESFLSSIDLKVPEKISDNKVVNNNNSVKNISSSNALKDKYAFNTTNFDDGWTSTVQTDWVEVTKGNVKVLIHYPKEGTIIQADPEPFINNAWNILVAPRYSNLKNYKVAPTLMEYERGYFSSGILTDNKTGKEVYVALFRRSNSGFIEFITPDKNTFVQNFGLDINTINYNSDSEIWNPLVKMGGYNKFAVAVSDFPGKWSNNYANNTYYANIYTGMSAGMSTYSSSETFEFTASSYNWALVAANSYSGNTNFVNAKASGTYKVLNNWQIYFSDIEKKPKTYNAYFSCIKGARILWLQDTGYGGYTSYGKVE